MILAIVKGSIFLSLPLVLWNNKVLDMTQLQSTKTNINIECPILKTNESLSSCYQRYDVVMRGDRLHERPACQALIHCGTCPIWALKRELHYKKSAKYFSDEIKEQVSRTLVSSRVLDVYVVDEEDRQQMQNVCGIYGGKDIIRTPKPRGRPKKSL